jgi:hypothetical protein
MRPSRNEFQGLRNGYVCMCAVFALWPSTRNDNTAFAKSEAEKQPRACHMRYYPTICRSSRGSPALSRPRSRSGAAWFCAVPDALRGLLTCMSVTPSLPRDLAPSALLRLKAL